MRVVWGLWGVTEGSAGSRRILISKVWGIIKVMKRLEEFYELYEAVRLWGCEVYEGYKGYEVWVYEVPQVQRSYKVIKRL
jgi:hypothetical protein